jgi:hypothetical protein
MTSMLRWSLGLEAVEFGSGGVGNNSLSGAFADYLAATGYNSWAAGEIASARAWIHTGKWDRNVYLTVEMESSDTTTQWGADGIGYLTIRHLIQRFGLSKTLDFWGAFEREHQSLDQASTAAFGQSWTSVNSDCVKYIEHLI